MRWKLLVITSLVAAVAGAGLFTATIYLILTSFDLPGKAMLTAGAALLLPVAAIIYAAIFVYRHTARRRKLQALLTVLFSLFLTVLVLYAAGVIINRIGRRPPVIY